MDLTKVVYKLAVIVFLKSNQTIFTQRAERPEPMEAAGETNMKMQFDWTL
jgi:hypothetical protein